MLSVYFLKITHRLTSSPLGTYKTPERSLSYKKTKKIRQQRKDNNRFAATILIYNSIISQNRQKGKSFCRFCKNYKCAEKEYCIYIILSLWCRKI